MLLTDLKLFISKYPRCKYRAIKNKGASKN